MSHNGVTLRMEGSVQLQVSAKSVGLFEAFYNSVKPVQLVLQSTEIAKPGKFPVKNDDLFLVRKTTHDRLTFVSFFFAVAM